MDRDALKRLHDECRHVIGSPVTVSDRVLVQIRDCLFRLEERLCGPGESAGAKPRRKRRPAPSSRKDT